MKFYKKQKVNCHSIDYLLQFLDKNLKAGLGLDEIEELPYIMMGMEQNKKEILQLVARDIYNYQLKDFENFYGENAIILFKTDNLMLRLVVWPSRYQVDKDKAKIFAEDLFHNHNFQLMTVGLWGPGYTTTMYSLDNKERSYKVDEHIGLTHQGEYTLSPGSVMFMDEYSDFHIQTLPEEVSVSLNIIVNNNINMPQLIVDDKSQTVLSAVQKDNAKEYIEKLILSIKGSSIHL